ELAVLDARPRRLAMLEELDRQLHVHRAFHGRSDDLAFAHPEMAVAERKERAGNAHAEIDGVAGADLGTVHVAPEIVGHDGRPGLAVCGSDAEAAEERAQGDLPRRAAIRGTGAQDARLLVHVVEPDGL